MGQVRGHTLQDKRAIWKVVQPTGITDALVAVFKKRRQVCVNHSVCHDCVEPSAQARCFGV